MKDEWRFTSMVNGEQSVIIPGAFWMHVLSADSLVSKMLRLLLSVLLW